MPGRKNPEMLFLLGLDLKPKTVDYNLRRT
ncbi:MAG: hypothetical protein ACI814_003996 [Mariniblastus sp.]